MSELIIKKINNKIIMEKGKNNSKEKEKENNEKIITNYDFLTLDNKELLENKDIQSTINFMFRMIKNRKDDELINELYNELLEIKDKTELYQLFKKTTSIFSHAKGVKDYSTENQRLINKLSGLYIKYPDYILNAYVIRLTAAYYNMIAKRINQNSISALYEQILNRPEDATIFNSLGIEFNEYNKKTNLYEIAIKEFKKAIKSEYNTRHKHLCWECATPIVECQKILDTRKKRLENYDFITDGTQVYSKSGNLETFTVTGCKKFIKSKKNYN